MAMRDLAEPLELGTARVVNLTTGRRDTTSATLCHFESFALDLRSRELRTGDRSTMLQAQPFELLRLLLDRAGQVVDRDDLRRRLWPEGTFVDYEHGLNAAVKRLRNVLGDDAGAAAFHRNDSTPRLPVYRTGVWKRRRVTPSISHQRECCSSRRADVRSRGPRQ